MRPMHALKVSLAAAAFLAAVPFFVSTATAQARESLADRVARLENASAQGHNASQGNVELLNRLTQLQSEVQSLRNLVEQQQNELEQLKQRSREQYIDLDSRLSRGAGQAAPPVSTGTPVGVGVATDPTVAPALDASAPAGASSAPVVANPADERAAYESAFDALKEGQYAESARRFQSFLLQYPQGDYTANAYYWLGESYYVTQNYEVALESFQALLDRFPSSAKAPDALLKLGYCQYELKQYDAAEATLNRVISQYPESTVAQLAQGRLRALVLENRR